MSSSTPISGSAMRACAGADSRLPILILRARSGIFCGGPTITGGHEPIMPALGSWGV